MATIALKLKGNKTALDILVKSNKNWLQSHKLFSANSQSGRLAGKIALITGAASGIGKAAAIKFIENGAKVILADVSRSFCQRNCKDLGRDASFIHCNVTNEKEVSSAVDQAVARYGRLDVMYNNAGAPGSLALTILDLELEEFDQTMVVNARSMVARIKHASRVMIPHQTGSIICTAGTTAILGGMTAHDYMISKAAVLGLVKSTAAELSQHGIRVNSISPHVIATPMGIDALKTLSGTDDDKLMIEVTHNTWEFRGARCEAADIANAALFLASNGVRYISGHNLVVDGGFTTCKKLNFALP